VLETDLISINQLTYSGTEIHLIENNNDGICPLMYQLKFAIYHQLK